MKFLYTLISLTVLISQITSCGKKQPEMDDISFNTQRSQSSSISGKPDGSVSGYVIYDIEKEKIIKHYKSNRAFIPASVTKLFTAVYALNLLGTEKKFTTELAYEGEINNKTLNGNLYLKGKGDSTLKTSDLLEMVLALKAKGIKKIKGKFIYDSGEINQKKFITSTMPNNAYYNSGYGSLNLNLNRIRIIKNGHGLYSIPSVRNIKVGTKAPAKGGEYEEVQFSNSGNNERWLYPANRVLNGAILPVKDTGLFTAMVLRKICRTQGIEIPIPLAGKMNSDTDDIYKTESPELIEIVKGLLKYSNNVKAEVIGSIASLLNIKDNGSNMTMESYFPSNFIKINWKGFNIDSFSGLSIKNRCTPLQVMAVLSYLNSLNIEHYSIESMLPVGGDDGTLIKRFTEPEYSYRVFAKTGTVFYASGLAGAFYGKSGKKYLFAVFIDDKTMRRKYDSAEEKRHDTLRAARRWTKSTEKSIDNFIKTNIDKL